MNKKRIYMLGRVAVLFFALFASLCAFGENPEKQRAFSGEWITTPMFENLQKINVFRRQLDGKRAAEIKKLSTIRNKHILFRKTFELPEAVKNARIYFSADDYAKIYINGQFVAQGPTAAYNFHYLYNTVDVSKFLKKGKNTIAVHSYYQGLINRVWVSGDNRHGFICDIVADGKTVLKSDNSFKYAYHDAFTATGIVGYDTQFMESYNASAPQVGFEKPDFDDSKWQSAVVAKLADYTLFESPLANLQFETIKPKVIERRDRRIFADFGAMYVGYFNMKASGKKGAKIELRFGQELNDDGSVRYKLRANCDYREHFILSGKKGDTLDQFDYKSFRYAEIIAPEGADIDEKSVELVARHMPFKLKAQCRYKGDKTVEKIWNLCVRSMQYGVQEQIQDCMDREKGYYLGDGCYTMLTYCVLTNDYAPMKKMVDDFLRTSFIDGGLVTCANCSFMQEIAEYPFMMFMLLPVLEKRDAEFVRQRMGQFKNILDYYAKNYAEKDGLLNNLDKWCVVEWPASWQDNYDVDVSEGKVCRTKHNVINAWYVGAVLLYNKTARRLGMSEYAGQTQLKEAFVNAFFDKEKNLFKDSVASTHTSFPANIYPWFLGLCPNKESSQNILEMVKKERMQKSILFITFPMFASLRRDGQEGLLYELLTDKNAWLKMLEEGATTTFEGWSKTSKRNASMFHLTLACAAVFMADYDINEIFE